LNFGGSLTGGLFYNPGIVKPFESPGKAGGLPILIILQKIFAQISHNFVLDANDFPYIF
jgi:hypothetical protein